MDKKPFNTEMIIPKDIVVSLENMLSYQNYKLISLINKNSK